jgi:prepilin signal peptidase PulO-like enzyme (type II secretory pathway)
VTDWGDLPLAARGMYGFVFGVLNGWFAGVVIERVPRRIGISGLGESPRSMCECGHLLGWRENIPIVSYLVQRGRARCCGRRIPRWYLGGELGLGVWCALAAALPRFWLALVVALAGFGVTVILGVVLNKRRVEIS